jgi:two-component system cell cycle response regulator
MLLNRDELVSALFSETDRAQRLKMPLALIGIADDALRQETLWDDSPAAARDVCRRITRILRSYDSVGTWMEGEFVLLLPGCSLAHAKMLAERLRDEVLAVPMNASGEKLWSKACFGVASSGGRSPLVVLREIECAMRKARAAGPGSVRSSETGGALDPEAFLIPVLAYDDSHW